MSLLAGATLLNGIGHLANLGQFVEIGQGQAFQREQMQWARRAYCLDSRALRIDLLNAVKEDVRDHHQTYASRIDTLLVVHTLLLTFALATLQYSDQFVPVSGCVECEENEHPWLVTCWVYSVSGILILPFWGTLRLIWSKLQLDHWLENSIGRLNVELRRSLSADSNCTEPSEDRDGTQLLDKVEGAVTRLSTFVVEHQESFKKVWNQECRFMISAATVFLWGSCILAILITSGMFWLFLQNHMAGQHRHAASHFALCTLSGLIAPVFYGLWYRLSCARRPSVDIFEDCIEPELPQAIRCHEGAPSGPLSSVETSISAASSRAAALLTRLRRGRDAREGSNIIDEGVLMAERPSGLPSLEDDMYFNQLT
ncbi:unnamed protein product [Effrenium voratum]|uniref:Uncharacterized protein n=1 Tax=Effrenium voratum TaxID=2562239 RepID=A0AA36MKH6_9DINO|nr:unnamed protein product [Effrenium voratum]